MKKILVMCMSLIISLCTNAQATDLVVDCQTPGWLSSKINYGDQLMVKNLKVTGYINDEDLRFIGSLTQKSLNGIVDLGNANIIGDTWCGAFKHEMGYNRKTGMYYVVEYDYDYHLQKLVLPKSLKTYNEFKGFNDKQEIDTLVFDTQVNKIAINRLSSYSEETNPTFKRTIGHLIIGENVDSIECIKGKSVHLPTALKYVADFACQGMVDLSKINIKEFPNLEYMGYCAFTRQGPGNVTQPEGNGESLPDSINLPNIKEYCMSSFEYKSGMHIFFGEKLEKLFRDDGIVYTHPWHASIDNVSFHLKSTTPPKNGMFNLIDCSSSVKIYVPKGTSQEWIAAGFTNVTLIEEPQPTGIDEVESRKVEARKYIYDLQGRKVKNPKNGLYIINGEKVLVK